MNGHYPSSLSLPFPFLPVPFSPIRWRVGDLSDFRASFSSIYLSIYLSICLSVDPSFAVSVCVDTHQSRIEGTLASSPVRVPIDPRRVSAVLASVDLVLLDFLGFGFPLCSCTLHLEFVLYITYYSQRIDQINTYIYHIPTPNLGLEYEGISFSVDPPRHCSMIAELASSELLTRCIYSP